MLFSILFIQNVLNDRRKQKEDGYYNRAMHKKGFGKDIDYLVCAIVEVPEVVVEKNLMKDNKRRVEINREGGEKKCGNSEGCYRRN